MPTIRAKLGNQDLAACLIEGQEGAVARFDDCEEACLSSLRKQSALRMSKSATASVASRSSVRTSIWPYEPPERRKVKSSSTHSEAERIA